MTATRHSAGLFLTLNILKGLHERFRWARRERSWAPLLLGRPWWALAIAGPDAALYPRRAAAVPRPLS